jgi:o-succinylbenzoate synthase
VVRVRIARATLSPFRLALRSPLETSRVLLRDRRGILLGLHLDGGAGPWGELHRKGELAVGWGEASPLPEFGSETLDDCGGALEKLAHLALGRDPRDLDQLLDEALQVAAAAPVARAAFDAALSDLAARLEGLSLAHWLGRDGTADPARAVEVNALLTGSTLDELSSSTRAAVRQGFQTLKLKVAGRSWDHDLARVEAVRSAAGPEVRVRLDANGGWTEDQAARALDELAPLEIEYVEQPVAAEALDAMVRLRERSPIPIAADEAVTDPEAVDAVIAAGAGDLIVLKPAVLGGLRSALRIASCATQAGLEVVVTSFLDSSIGTASALHLAAWLAARSETRPRASGLATAGLFVHDLARGPRPTRGRLEVSHGLGLGLAPSPEALSRASERAPLELRA